MTRDAAVATSSRPPPWCSRPAARASSSRSRRTRPRRRATGSRSRCARACRCRRRVHAVPPDGPAPPRDAPSAALRGAARARRAAAQRRGRALRRRARAPRRRQPGDGRRDGTRRRATICGSTRRGSRSSTARFPTLSTSLAAAGLDPEVDWLPIAPAAHHLAGGIVTDLDGATALPGLLAVGEVACTGVHGANRLASNSLLEGMVFAARLSEALESGSAVRRPPARCGRSSAADRRDRGSPTRCSTSSRRRHRRAGDDRRVATHRAAARDDPGAGVVRSAGSLRVGPRRARLGQGRRRGCDGRRRRRAREPRHLRRGAPHRRPSRAPSRGAATSARSSPTSTPRGAAASSWRSRVHDRRGRRRRGRRARASPRTWASAATSPAPCSTSAPPRARRSSRASPACSPARPARPRPSSGGSARRSSSSATTGSPRARRRRRHRRRTDALDRHRRADRAQLPRPPVGIATATRALIDAVARSTRPARPRHPQDHARAARTGEGGGAGRRRHEPPRVAVRGGAAEGQPPRRSSGSTAAVAAREGEVARRFASRSSATRPTARRGASPRVRTRSCSTTWTPTLARCVRRHRPRARAPPSSSRRRAGSRSRPRRAIAAAGVDAVSGGRATHSARGARPRRSDLARDDGVMLLAIDAGNTETVVGLYELDGADARRSRRRGGTRPPRPDHHWRLSTVAARTPDEHAVVLTQLLDLEGLDVDRGGHRHRDQLVGARGDVAAAPDGGEVVPACTASCSARGRGPGCRSATRTRRRSARTGSPTPSGAFDLYGGPCIVVDLGTATTFDAISSDGEYLGGAIVPGVAISLDALYAHAAALRAVELVEPRGVIGQSTEEAIQSGVLYGFAAQVDGMCARFTSVLGRVRPRRDGGPRVAHRAVHDVDRPRRALADAARAAHHLRAQRGDARERASPTPSPTTPSPATSSSASARSRPARSPATDRRGRRPRDARAPAGQARLRHAARLDRRGPAVRARRR